MEIPVSVGCGRREIDARAGYSVEPTEIVAEDGLMGVAGREWFMYHANILCPNFAGSDEAPTTAK